MFSILGRPLLVAQGVVNLRSEKFTPQNCRTEFTGDALHLINTSKKTAILWLDNVMLKSGVIELDIKGKDVMGESFLGVAFHPHNDSTYTAVYFRPFAFNNEEKKGFAVQYVELPGLDWDVLRENFPGQYEGDVTTVPDANDWFHARIQIDSQTVTVYVNNSPQPSLVVKQNGKHSKSKIGFWVDSEDGWFKNLRVVGK